MSIITGFQRYQLKRLLAKTASSQKAQQKLQKNIQRQYQKIERSKDFTPDNLLNYLKKSANPKKYWWESQTEAESMLAKMPAKAKSAKVANTDHKDLSKKFTCQADLLGNDIKKTTSLLYHYQKEQTDSLLQHSASKVQAQDHKQALQEIFKSSIGEHKIKNNNVLADEEKILVEFSDLLAKVTHENDGKEQLKVLLGKHNIMVIDPPIKKMEM